MIKNERQYKITKAKIREFEATLAHVQRQSDSDEGLHPKLRQAQPATVRTLLADLKAEAEEYERMRASDVGAAES